MSVTVKVRVPGTTANCGPGFDTVGVACTIYNSLELTLTNSKKLTIEISGEGEGVIPVNENNIVFKAVQAVMQKTGENFEGLTIKMINHIPLARGLGSSAAAIVGGLLAANQITGNTLTKQELFNMATDIEGHPDNVAPALFGGITISVVQDGAKHLRFLPARGIIMVVAIPDFQLSTKTARKVLPASVPLEAAIFNISRTAMLVGALCTGDYAHLKYALQDKIHQPYRMPLIPGIKEVFHAAVSNGAFGATISGAGPCLIAFTEENPDQIGNAMVEAFNISNIKSKYLILGIDSQGATLIP